MTKGHKHSEESKRKISESNKGRIVSNITRKKISEANKKMIFSEEHRKKISKAQTGKRQSLETRLKRSGKRNHFWKGGVNPLQNALRRCWLYNQWRSSVFERDNWSCQTCQGRGIRLEAHHIKSFALIFKEFNIKTFQEGLNCDELWDINNGVTLCKDCHKLTKKYESW